MGKMFLMIFFLLLGVAFITKPDDKTCIIGGVKAVWGIMMPNPEDKPDFFEEFMNLYSPNVRVNDWIFFKTINYKLGNEEKTVALGAFKNVFPRVKPLEYKPYIPQMPQQNGKQ